MFVVVLFQFDRKGDGSTCDISPLFFRCRFVLASTLLRKTWPLHKRTGWWVPVGRVLTPSLAGSSSAAGAQLNKITLFVWTDGSSEGRGRAEIKQRGLERERRTDLYLCSFCRMSKPLAAALRIGATNKSPPTACPVYTTDHRQIPPLPIIPNVVYRLSNQTTGGSAQVSAVGERTRSYRWRRCTCWSNPDGSVVWWLRSYVCQMI